MILKNKKVVVIIVVLVLALGSGALAWKQQSGSKAANTTDASGINYGPPTKEDKEDAERHKKELEEKLGSGSTTPETSQPRAEQANIVLTYATYGDQKVQASGIISNVFEDDGICTLVLTREAFKITATSQGFRDVNKTTCAPLTIERSKLPEGGEWSASLSYSSKTTSGASAARAVQVP